MKTVGHVTACITNIGKIMYDENDDDISATTAQLSVIMSIQYLPFLLNVSCKDQIFRF